MKRNNKKGFTIVELVVVIAVIAILAAVLIPTFSGITTKAKKSAALQEAKNALTSDLAVLDADAANYGAKGFKVTEDDAAVNGKKYYTLSGNIATDATFAEGVYEKIVDGEFTNISESGYTYKFVSGTYTCTYTSSTGNWNVQ